MFAGLENNFKLFNKGTPGRPPPGPKGLPLLGSLLQARREPLDFARELIRRYGDIVHFKVGFYTGYLLNHPDYLQHVLSSNNHNYNKENYNYKKLKPVLGEGLITSDGDQWLRHRRLIQPAFHRKNLGRVGDITIKATNEMLTRWDSIASHAQSVNVAAEMMKLTLGVVTKSLFSVDIRSSTNTVGKAFTNLNEDIAYRFKNVFVLPLWVPTQRNRAFKKARDELNRFVYKIIDRRRLSNESRNDLLGALLSAREELPEEQGLSDREIRDEVMTLLLAGHETTANLLTWTLYLVSQHPTVEQKVRAELDEVLQGRVPGVEDISALNYVKKVLQESLRLYPPVWIISRNAINNDSIGGYSIPAGATVTLCLYTLNRHPDFWENPEKFNPERFDAEKVKTRHQYAYLPFGGGPRSCIGKHFAMLESQLILAMIFRRYHLRVVEGYSVEPEPLVTLRPRNGLRMVLEPVSSIN